MTAETLEAPVEVAEVPSGPATQSPAPESKSQPPVTAPSAPSDEPHYGDSGEPDRSEAPPRVRGPNGRFVPKERVAPATHPAPSQTAADPLAAALPPAPTAPAPTAQPAADWLTGDALRHAEFYGFTPDEARAFGDPDRLYTALAAIDRRLMAQLSTGEVAPQQPSRPEATQSSAAGDPRAAQPTTNSGATGLAKFDLTPFKEKFDDDTNSVLEALNEHYHGMLSKVAEPLTQQQDMVRQLAEAHRQMDEYVARQEGARFEAEMDAYFAKLGDDYADVFGKGPMRDVTDHKHAQGRREFVAHLVAMQGVDERLGRGSAARPEVADRVLRAYYGGIKEAKIRDQVRREVEQRKSQAIAPPTGRTTQESVDPLKAAARRANEFYRSKGFDVTEGERPDEFEF